MSSTSEEDRKFNTNKNIQLLWLAKATQDVDDDEHTPASDLHINNLGSNVPLQIESRIMIDRRIDFAVIEANAHSIRSVGKLRKSECSRSPPLIKDHAATLIQSEWRRSRLIRSTAAFVASTTERKRTEVMSRLNFRASTGERALSFVLPTGKGHGRFIREQALQREVCRHQLLRYQAVLRRTELEYASKRSARHDLFSKPTLSGTQAAVGGSAAALIMNRSLSRSLSTIAANVVSSMHSSIAQDVEMQRLGCASLSDIAKGAAIDAQVVMDANGGNTVLRAMRAFPSSAELQCEACIALINLTKSNPNAARRLVHAGAAACIVDAMRLHTRNGEVLSWALAALAFLAQHGLKMAEAVLAAEGLTAAVVAMKAAGDSNVHGMSASVLHWGIVVFGNIAQHGAQVAKAVAQAGAAASVADAMRAHPMATEMQRDGAVALLSMAKHDDEGTNVVIQAGGQNLSSI